MRRKPEKQRHRMRTEGMPRERTSPARSRTCLRRTTMLTIGLTLILLSTGCHHRRRQAYVPPAPALHGWSSQHSSESAQRRSESSEHRTEPHESREPRGPVVAPEGRPAFVETGMASWYGPSGHRTADGSSYDGTGMTAAHKTLPLGTIARVTNLVNGESVVVRITDRGPFAHGRILDLSESAAKQIDLYRMGVAKVRIEAFANGAASPEGRWCVQTGAFKSERDAIDLKEALLRRYAGARVTEFTGATGYWVRIDPVRHDHADADAILDWIGKPSAQAVAYVVRID